MRNDQRADWSGAWALFACDIAYVWHGALHATTVAESLVANEFTIRAQIIWAKERLVMGRGDYHWQHEPCWYAVRKKGNWTGDRKQTTLWAISSGGQDAETKHSTQKPVECMRRPILNNSNPGHTVYDPFLGSGTTLIAAQTVGRTGPAWDWSLIHSMSMWRCGAGRPFTGEKATRLADGGLFDAIEMERPADTETVKAPTAPRQPPKEANDRDRTSSASAPFESRRRRATEA